jgi:hypothetical protein
MNHLHNTKVERQCGDCTSCCEGWLTGDAYGHNFFPGQPCFYLCKSGCSIYEKRPENPCRLYQCVWLKEPDVFPVWMKPKDSNVICSERDWVDKNGDSQLYLSFSSTGEEMTVKTYHWIIKFYFDNKIPITVQFHEDIGIYGPDDFIDYIKGM